jgi:drug/metabolite transporter (DMT)-like permease
LLSILLYRALLAALPFLAYFVWREIARRRGQVMGSTPWGWLVAAGAVLVALSLFLTVIFHTDNRNQVYVPAQAHPGGQVTPGGFAPTKP